MSAPFEEPRRLCRGPAHPEPALLPATEQYFHFHRSGPSTGQPLSRCKQCQNWTKLQKKSGPHGRVPTEEVFHWIEELIWRCGSVHKIEKAYGIRNSTLAQIVRRDYEHVQKRTAQRILTALVEQRKADRQNGMRDDYREQLITLENRRRALEQHAFREVQEALHGQTSNGGFGPREVGPAET